MTAAPQRFYSAQQVGELDRRAIEDHGIPGYELMTRAGAAAFRLLGLRWPGARRVAVYCGGGNNGGDGLVVARLARAAGLEVELALKGDPDRLKGAARDAWHAWSADTGGQAAAFEDVDPARADVVVDALLGTGLDRPVAGAIGAAIERVNASGRPVLALDIPSGLQADTGAVMGSAVRAAATITFIGRKRGLHTAAGPDCTGPVFTDDLGVPAAVFADGDAAIAAIARASIAPTLPRHRPCAHKGDRGRVLVIGGERGFAGAPRLAAEAALRTGAGLVTVATRREHAPAMAAARPELMARGVEDPASELPPLLDAADVVLAGPGLDRCEWGRGMLGAVQRAGPARLVLDADGLNLAAEHPSQAPAASVITPHPGEAGRLLGSDATAVQADRFAALDALVDGFGCAVLLKGAGTLVGAPGEVTALLPGADPALGVGGTGDVLAGLVAGLLGQGMGTGDACRAAAWLHAAAARVDDGGRPQRRLPSELAPAVAAEMERLVAGAGTGTLR